MAKNSPQKRGTSDAEVKDFGPKIFSNPLSNLRGLFVLFG